MTYQSKTVHYIKHKPVFLLLLPVFFVLHGYTGYYYSVAPGDALLLLLLYTGCSFLIAGICHMFCRDWLKACLIAFALMLYNFFFGGIQDQLKNISSQAFISQYRFILPVSFLFLLAIIIWLKKRKKPLLALAYYLNILFVVLLLIDSGRLIIKMTRSDKDISRNPVVTNPAACDTCKKPDIYLIIPDQYAGSIALKEVFGFDNTAFEEELNRRGFHIAAKSSSNYNLTPFSVASTLNMDYLDPEMGQKNHLNVDFSYRAIRNNRVLGFLSGCGYQFYNHSVFDFPGQPAHKYGAFLPYGIQLITSQTFTSRLAKDIRADILSGKLGFKTAQKKIAYEYLHFNDDILKLTRSIAATRSTKPRFVYAHLMMPHYPYYFDSKGNPLPIEKLSGFRNTNSTDYIEYLQYGNEKILELVDHILAASAIPPVIILLSDHGFRHPEKGTKSQYDFMNLNAVYLPGKNDNPFPDSITNVNQFRILFNSCFGQRFPLLKDSTIDLWD